MQLIDFDNPKTINNEIFRAVSEFRDELKNCNMCKCNTYIDCTLKDRIMRKMDFLNDYEMTGWHHTRVVNVSDIEKNGIIKPDADSISKILQNNADILGFDEISKNYLVSKSLNLYSMQKQRKNKIWFTSCYLPIPQYKKFMLVIGGEAVERALDNELSNQPFKRLVDYGVPVGIKFKYKFKDIFINCKDDIIEALIRYVYAKKKEVLLFEASIVKSIPPEDILSIRIAEKVPYYFSDDPF